MEWILNHLKDLAELLAAAIAVASIIVKLTPTLKDDSILLPVIKFIGKYIALNKYGPENRPN